MSSPGDVTLKCARRCWHCQSSPRRIRPVRYLTVSISGPISNSAVSQAGEVVSAVEGMGQFPVCVAQGAVRKMREQNAGEVLEIAAGIAVTQHAVFHRAVSGNFRRAGYQCAQIVAHVTLGLESVERQFGNGL